MKKLAKGFVASILGWQVRRLRNKNNFKVIAVGGSIGKTSTKLAVARVLEQEFKVRFQDGNYNDPVSVPLVFFGQKLPSIFNPLAWLTIFWKNEQIIKKKYPYEVVVVELGTDGPGQIKQFERYINADIGILSAITPEHMVYFGDLDAVAREELYLGKLVDKLFINQDLVPVDYLKDLSDTDVTYGIKNPAQIRMTNIKFDENSASFKIGQGPTTLVEGEHEQITEPQLYSITAATAVAQELGMAKSAMERGIKSIKPVSGRMQHLEGIKNSLILDDTYNASPEAMLAALDTLYRINAPQKIAVLGNMNELGDYSQREHKAVGEYCDPKELDLVVTIGPDANKYLASAAEEAGCNVKTFSSPYAAGRYVKEILESNAVVLVKGSQNRVFAEEAVKILLANPKDSSKLVRQSEYWLKIKQKAFKDAEQ
jgi:UDP-N-acetylmuramoyl-tripeptide--D-alanyl-D-alanine ligase